jgi:hypothetical protein
MYASNMQGDIAKAALQGTFDRELLMPVQEISFVHIAQDR